MTVEEYKVEMSDRSDEWLRNFISKAENHAKKCKTTLNRVLAAKELLEEKQLTIPLWKWSATEITYSHPSESK